MRPYDNMCSRHNVTLINSGVTLSKTRRGGVKNNFFADVEAITHTIVVCFSEALSYYHSSETTTIAGDHISLNDTT